MVYKIVGNNFDQRSVAELTRRAEGRMPDVTRLLGQQTHLERNPAGEVAEWFKALAWKASVR